MGKYTFDFSDELTGRVDKRLGRQRLRIGDGGRLAVEANRMFDADYWMDVNNAGQLHLYRFVSNQL